ncbi:MAG: hypothetical protein GC154_20480 [bacterium]|nr:hypothetical protein [bacterium]
MKRVMAKQGFDWIGLLVVAAIVGMLFAAGAYAQTTAVAGEKLFRLSLQEEKGTKVDISVPFSLLELVVDSAPKPIADELARQKVPVKEIIAELKKSVGQDLVEIKGKSNIKLGVVPWQSEEDDFLRVHVEPGDENTESINVNLPKGLVAIACTALKEMDIQAPNEDIKNVIEEIMKNVNEGMKAAGQAQQEKPAE